MSIEKIASPERCTQEFYERYLSEVAARLGLDPNHPEKEPRKRPILYVPYRGVSEQLRQDCPNVTFTDPDSLEVTEAVHNSDVIINIARGEEVVKEEPGRPDRNVRLPSESLANTEMVGELYLQAIEAGNSDVQVVHTGRMNNRAIAAAKAIPIIAELIGCNYEDLINMPEDLVWKLLEEVEINDNYDPKDKSKNEPEDELRELIYDIDTNPHKEEVRICTQALKQIYEAHKINEAKENGEKPKGKGEYPIEKVSSLDLIDSLFDAYRNYPRISTSTLMKEKMLRDVAEKLRDEGKSENEINEVVEKLDEFTDEEPDSVDTVTNFTNSIPMILSKQSMLLSKRLIEKGHATESVSQMSIEQKMEQLGESEMTAVIVADIAHMPRVMWLADYLLPDCFKLVLVESRTDLSEAALISSMEREKRSFMLGSNWLFNQMKTRDPAKVGELADKAYWGKNSISNAELNDKIKNAGNSCKRVV